MLELNKLYNMDCMEGMSQFPDKYFDLILQDPPYGITGLEWDIEINLNELWKEWLRIGKDNAVYIFTSSQPFTSKLILSNEKMFKYEIIWEKTMPSNIALANKMPLKYHENICIFYKKNPTYNPIKEKRSATGIERLRGSGRIKSYENYRNKEPKKSATYFKYEINRILPKSIQKFNSEPNCNGTKLHPTQKPVDLFRYLIKTYTNKDELIYDGYMGSGTTAIAAIEENRNFIGFEIDKDYYKAASKRIENHKQQLKLF